VHLCDARGPIPSPTEGLRDEARLNRYDPGNGDLALDRFLDAMPADACLGVEAPCSFLAVIPPPARGPLPGPAARDWLRRHDERRARNA
jgi:hypothetical protein